MRVLRGRMNLQNLHSLKGTVEKVRCGIVFRLVLYLSLVCNYALMQQ